MNGRVPVVTGTGAICSVGCDSESVWLSLAGGNAGFRPLTLFHSSRYGQTPVAEVVADVNSLCGAAIRGSRSDKLAFLAVRQALADAGLEKTIGEFGNRAGIVLGATVGGILGTEQFLDSLVHGNRRRYGLLRHHECACATDLCAKTFHCFGPTTTLSTACSGGAMAIALAGRLIESGAADVVIAGGCDSLCRLTVNGFGSLLLLDPNGCRPFDLNRAGISLGEGAAALIIESAQSAARRGVPVLARLAGWGCSCDAFHATAPDSEGSGAYRAMSAALRRAGLEPAAIDHINAHGTGTPGNDLAESKAIRRLFGEAIPGVLSTKGLLGHTLGASGAIDSVICVKSIEHGGPPQSLKFETLDPDIGFEPVRKPLGKPQSHVMNNAFGFGGNNVSLVFSRADDAPPAPKTPGRPGPAKTRRFPIAGIGMVTPMGNVTESVFSACSPAGATATLREIVAPLPSSRVPVYSCAEEFGAREDIAAGRRRRLERIQLMTLVAAKRSCHGLSLDTVDGDRICVAMGTGLGSAAATAAFVEPIIADDNAAPSPQKFTNAVHNALASQVAMEICARGLNSTVTHREISFESALWHGVQEIEEGTADYAVVGGADELTPYLLSAGVRWGWWDENTRPLRPLSANLTLRQQAMAGEGAVVFSLTRQGGDRPALAEIACIAFGRFAVEERSGIAAEQEAEWIERELADQGIDLKQIDLVLSGANGRPSLDAMYTAVVAALGRRAGREIRHGGYKHLCGEYHTASAFGMAMAVGLVSQRVAPEVLLSPGGDCRVVLLYTLSGEGTHAITCIARAE